MNTNEIRPDAMAAQAGTTQVAGTHAPDAHAGDEANAESGGQLMLPLTRGTHVMRAAQPDAETGANDVIEQEDISVQPRSAASIELHEGVSEALGQRLVAARERQGWSRADVATRLKLPVKLIARLEGDDYAGLTDGVFLRGYLASYARLVGVPVEQATRVAAAHTMTAPLVATGTISRSRYLFDRYSVSATYLVLTAIIVVPAVWLATHGGLEQNLARTTPLDPPTSIATPVRDPALAGTSMQPAGDGAADGSASVAMDAAPLPPKMAAVDQTPVIASMAPFASASTQNAETPASGAIAGSGAHQLDLTLSESSWVEITAADGRKLEYGILAAGSEHRYRSDGPVSIRLGNVQGAQIRGDGNVIDLSPYQRGNVAHVKLFGAGGAGVSRVEQ